MTFTLSEVLGLMVATIGAVAAAIAIYRSVFNSGFRSGTLPSEVKELKDSFNRFKDELRVIIRSQLLELGFYTPTTDTNSPRTLSDLGKRISKKLDVKGMARSLVPDLTKRVNGLAEYDVQNVCLEFVLNEFEPTSELDEKIKKCAYDNGIGKDAVLAVLAIELGDILLKPDKK